METTIRQLDAATAVLLQIYAILRAHGIAINGTGDPFRDSATATTATEVLLRSGARLELKLTIVRGALPNPIVYPVRVRLSVTLVCGPLISDEPTRDGVIVVGFEPEVSRWTADEYSTLSALPQELRLQNIGLPEEVFEETHGSSEERWKQKLPTTNIAVLRFISQLIEWFVRQPPSEAHKP